MFKNYLRIAWRSILENKLFAFLNMAGLALGLCVCILHFAYVSHELSFEQGYRNARNIYRVNMVTTAAYNFEKWAELPNAVGPSMLQDIPQVALESRVVKNNFGAPASLTTGERNFVENGLYLADAALFKIFDFNFTEGTPSGVFSQPGSIVLSESAKERMFGKASAYGKTIFVNNRDTLHVTGVYKDLPVNSTLDCDMISNIMDSWMGKNQSWSNASFETYCLLKPNVSVPEVERQATALINKYVEKENQYYSQFVLQPLTQIHLYSGDLRPGYSSRIGSIGMVKGLSFLSALILLIACINYMNLATARSRKRAKAVGVSKVLGALRHHIMLQFYLETGILSLVAIIAGYLLSLMFFPVFRQILAIDWEVSQLYSLPFLFSLLIIWFIVTLLSGFYPAFKISGFSSLSLMRKLKVNHPVEDFFRKGLVIFQFAASAFLIIAVITVLEQMRFIRQKDLGYNPKGVISLSIRSVRDKQQIQTAIQDLKKLASIDQVSAVQTIPGGVESGRSIWKSPTDKIRFPIKSCHADGPVVQTMQFQLLAGSDLPNSIAKEDTTCYTLVNETVASYLGFKTPQEAVGKPIFTEMGEKSVILGVVRNFNYQSLRNEIGAYVYYEMNDAPESLGTLLVRYHTGNLSQLLDQLQAVFKTDLPTTAFDYQFLDNHIQNLYATEQRISEAAKVFAGLAIFIACLGLFGLAAFTAEQRTKEIGIRKVLGASVSGIARLLSWDFLKLVFISFIVASPLSWWMMDRWLRDYVYRIHMQGWVFLEAGLVVMMIAALTVSFQAVKAALSNPVRSLGTE